MTTARRQFRFRAYGPNGAAESGVVEAADLAEAGRILARQGKTAFDLKPARSGTRPGTSSPGLSLFRAKLDLVTLLSDLAVMLNSGFTVDVSLRAVGQSQANAGQRARIEAIHSRLSEGMSVAEAFRHEPGVPDDVVALIESGERGGHMAQVFSELAKNHGRIAEQRGKIVEALLYPAFLVFVLIGTLLLLATYLVPAIEPIFDSGGAEKPMVVSILSAIGSALTHFWPLILAALLLAGLGVFAALRSHGGRRAISRLLVRLPVIGTVMRRSLRARYLRSMALLLANGVQLNEAMRLSAGGMPVGQYRHQLEAAREAVIGGSAFWSAMEGSGVFDGSMVSLFRLGEESNNLPVVMNRAASLTEFLLQRSLTRMLSFLTPAITILMGVVIGSLVISVMTTLLSVNELAIR
ncbi:MAG: type II secretion system F family protein [Nitratireductor sp.]|nr:type II secretion system F family protein [Nitratireductor sp.]